MQTDTHSLDDARPAGVAVQWIGIAAVSGAAAAGLYFFNPAEGGWLYPACPFRAVTGWLCPGCGTLRAVHQMLHGNFAEALRLNLLAVIAAPFAGMRMSYRATVTLRSKNVRPQRVYGKKWMWGGVAVAVVFGVLRNVL